MDRPKTFFFPCRCGGTHEAPYDETATPGLAVVDRTRVWCPVTFTADSEGWNLTHLATGRSVPWVFDNPVDAEEAAQALAESWDWLSAGRPDSKAQKAIRVALIGLGRGFYSGGVA